MMKVKILVLSVFSYQYFWLSYTHPEPIIPLDIHNYHHFTIMLSKHEENGICCVKYGKDQLLNEDPKNREKNNLVKDK